MKKRNFKIAVSAIAGGVLLSCSIAGFAVSGSGYQSYKNAVEATVLADNATVNAQFDIKDNGTSILSGNVLQKLDKENRSSDSSITASGATKAYQSSSVNGNRITETDGKYYSMNMGDRRPERDKLQNLSSSSSTVKLAEMLADTLVGDVKNQFVMDGKSISVKLEGAQIPELAKLALSAAVENSSRRDEYKNNDRQDQEENMKSVFSNMPQLSTVDIKSISMTATVDGNALKDNKFSIEITGNDAKGASHDITVVIDANISDVGSTKVVPIDTTGKEVKTINWEDHHSRQ